ncbi:AAA family ATPase [Sphaerisporangium melleum]|uniref:ATP-binding protein n=1 Tax=Sphaerisporangium melleum TaxID=321316 RepID=UPI0016663C3B|nr:AAA family ATPase [Sphaerisporangium melleum]
MGNLPVETTSFVGRRHERAEIARMLQESRVVTLTGGGGIGKTRLALRAARELTSRFPHGVWLVELSSLCAPEALGDAIGSALGVPARPGRPALDVLAEFLARRRALLVLDTCEHLACACAAAVGRLLQAAPGLRVLATGRRVLGVPGEARLEVGPLPVEEDGAGTGAEGAVALFADRAAAAVPGFTTTPEVTALCRRLDGVPLAIELAAARMTTLPLPRLLDGAGDLLDLLSDAGRDGTTRHRAMRTSIGWSHQLCEPPERLLWARLSVFTADFDLRAAQAVGVCPDDATGPYPEDIEDLLLALVDKSVVLRLDTGAAIRFRMLGAVRAYGAAWLRELGQTTASRRRHRDHYLALARRFDEEWFGPEQAAWYARVRHELPHLRAALDFCLDEPAERGAGLDLAGRLACFWAACGFVAEGRRHLRRALSYAQPAGPVLSRALWASAWLADLQGDLDEANDLATECLSQAFPQHDLTAVGWGTAWCAATGLRWGYVAEALSLYESARQTHEDGGDRRAGLALAVTGQAHALWRLGRHEQALACLRWQRSLCGAWGDIWLRSSGEAVRSLVEADRGDFAAADERARAALRDKTLLHDAFGMAFVLGGLAHIAAERGDMERAARLLGSGQLVESSFGLCPWLPREDGLRERTESRVRAALGDRPFDTAFARGRDLDVDTALANALADLPTHRPA